MNRFRHALIVAFSALCAAGGHASTISWGTNFASTLVDSNGATLDGNMVFELGSFGSFVPTASNLDLWATNWKPFDRATSTDGWSVSAQFVTSYATINPDGTSSSSPPLPSFTFGTGEQAYIWAYKSNQAFTAGLQWALVTNDALNGTADDWKFPASSNQTAPVRDWRLSTASTVIFGGLNNSQGAGTHSSSPSTFDLQTHTLPSVCAITAIIPTVGACNDNGTPTVGSDDYYLSSVTVTMMGPPLTGTLNLSGAAIHSGTYFAATGPTSYTFTNVKLRAMGTALPLSAAFSVDPSCTLQVTVAAVSSCSTVSCPAPILWATGDRYRLDAVTGHSGYQWTRNGVAISGATSDNYIADQPGYYEWTATKSNACPTGSCCPLILQARDYGDYQGFVSATQVPSTAIRIGTALTDAEVANPTSGNATTDDSTTAPFVDDEDLTMPTLTVGTSSSLIVPVTLTAAQINGGTARVGAWIDWNGDNLVSGINETLAPQIISASGSLTFTLTPPTGTTTGTKYLRLRITEGNVAPTFNGDSASLGEVEDYAITLSLPQCAISTIAISSGACDNNGTPIDASDDFHLATVTVNFVNRPTTGTLALSGAALHSGTYSVAANSTTSAISHTFSNVKLKATGAPLSLTASFSADAGCFLTSPAPSVSSCAGTCPNGNCRSSIVTKL